MASINDGQIRESIYQNFSNIQDLIKHAETKNTAIVGSSGAIIALVFDKLCFDDIYQIFFSLGYSLIFLALIISFWSIRPIKHPNELNKKKKETDKTILSAKNLFLFTDIASFPSYAEYEETIKKKYYSDSELISLEKDLLIQIHTNANIALRKFELFKYSLYVFLIGIFLIVTFGPFK